MKKLLVGFLILLLIVAGTILVTEKYFKKGEFNIPQVVVRVDTIVRFGDVIIKDTIKLHKKIYIPDTADKAKMTEAIRVKDSIIIWLMQRNVKETACIDTALKSLDTFRLCLDIYTQKITMLEFRPKPIRIQFDTLIIPKNIIVPAKLEWWNEPLYVAPTGIILGGILGAWIRGSK